MSFGQSLLAVVIGVLLLQIPGEAFITQFLPHSTSIRSSISKKGCHSFRLPGQSRTSKLPHGVIYTILRSEAKDTEASTYDWKDHWYALTFASYIPNPSESAETIPAAIFGIPLVLWRGKDEGKIYCADDICPHRSSALSEGRVRDGKIECQYHGWQFDGEETKSVGTNVTSPAGRCTHIPQLPSSATIPRTACLKMRRCEVVEGIVWVWMGNGVPTKPVPIQNDGLDPMTGEKEGFFVNDFQMDLPYDHSYLVENILDPAHVSISHDRTTGGGRREKAEAYEMIVDSGSFGQTGFVGRFRLDSQKQKGDPFTEVVFEAPGIVRQKGFPRGTNSTLQFGAALHCMPLAAGRSRLLFRTYFGGLPWLQTLIVRCKPKFLRNLNGCKLLEQDARLIATQQDHFERNPSSELADDFLLLGSSDVFVKTYRKWLDLVGDGMPWFQGLLRHGNLSNNTIGIGMLQPALDPTSHRAGQVVETRFHRHVVHCPVTRKALRRVQTLKKVCLATVIMALASSCWVASFGAVETPSRLQQILLNHVLRHILLPLVPLAGLVGSGLHRLEKSFHVSYDRKVELRRASKNQGIGTHFLGHLFQR